VTGPALLRFRRVGYDSTLALGLIEELAADLAQFYGPHRFPDQDPAMWRAPDGAFVLAYLDGAPVACGGLIRFDRSTAELKRIFTQVPYRGRGIGARVVAGLLDEARALGYQRLVVETGRPQLGAQRLYQQAGFASVPCWAPHDADPLSLCYSRHVPPLEADLKADVDAEGPWLRRPRREP
jgi:GNAT superfamily N-acetyltransferase